MNFIHKIAFIVVLVLLFFRSEAQVISPDLNGKPMSEVASNLSQQGFQVFFEKDEFKHLIFKIPNDSADLGECLDYALGGTSAHFFIDKNGWVYFTEAPIQAEIDPKTFSTQTENTEAPIERKATLQTSRKLGVQTIILGTKKGGAYESVATISGHVVNNITGKPVFGATIFVDELKDGSLTDENGNFELKLSKGTYNVMVRSLEYEEQKFIFKVLSSDKINIKLDSKFFSLDEVIITADAKANVDRPIMGIEKLTTKAVSNIPRVMGQTDIVKVALLLPGVQSVGEGTGGYNVRGAPADQNIFYLNKIPVYNTSHLMGFFTAFTPNALNSFTLYKSSFPAQFGGRLSSVFDIETKDGSTEKFMLKGGVSPITGDILLETSPIKDKLSIAIGARTTYSDWLLKTIKVPAFANSTAKFNDQVVVVKYKINNKNSLKATGYNSYDRIKLNGLSDFNYRNQGGALSWERIIKDKHHFELSAVDSRYHYNEYNTAATYLNYELNYALRHSEAKALLRLSLGQKHETHVGVSSILYQNDPGTISPYGEQSLLTPLTFEKEKAIESAVFLNETWKLNARITINGGLRLNTYQFLGPKNVYSYLDESNLSINSIIDTTIYAKNKVVASYINPDIRLSTKYALSEFFSLKAAVNQVHQYINMLSNTVAIAPNAKWKLADQRIKPMQGWQYSIGAFKNLKFNKYEIGLELYYKQVSNLTEFKDGANLIATPIPETEMLQGQLDAYGLEFMAKKNKGKLTGWFNYTYARSLVTVPGINFGEQYPANFDKPHAINIVASYKFSRRLNVSGNMAYSSGRPVTYPVAAYYQFGMPLPYYSKRNEYRIPNYLRFDLSTTIEGNLKKNKALHGSWNFSVYNLFGRNNAFTVYAVQEGLNINGYKLSIFGAPIFSVAYQFKLGHYEN